jgi:hypothetical protein
MIPLSASSIRRGEVDVLLTHIMRAKSKVCAIAETVYVVESSLDQAIERDFEEE